MTGTLEPTEAVISHFVCDASLYCKPPKCEDKNVSVIIMQTKLLAKF